MNVLSKKNVCIVGYGVIGPVHAKALEETKNAKIYAVCDVDPERMNSCKEQYGVVCYTDFYEMLEDKNIDSIHICTPHYLHYEMISAGLKAGKSVVVEKPMVMTKKEYEMLMCTEGVDKVCLVFQNRLNPCVRHLKALVQKQELGKLVCARGIVTWNRTKDYYESGAWRGKLATEGGGVLINQAVHTLDLMNYLAEDIQSVKAHMANDSLCDIIEVEDTVSAYLKYKGGATGIFYATNAHGRNNSPDIELVFENGTARYVDGALSVNNEVVCRDIPAKGEKAYYGLGHGALLQEYYDYGRYFSVYDAKNTMEALFAMYESAQSGQEVFLG